MATAKIYTLFRSIIGDETPGDYDVPDLQALTYLDKAIDKLSEFHDYVLEEEITITAADVSNGYFQLSNDIVQILDGLPNKNVLWRYGKGRKIQIIRSDFPTGDYRIRYRAKYKKFEYQLRDEDYFDFDDDAILPVVMYAVGLWLQVNNIQKPNGESGLISRKSEENQSIEYGVNSVIAQASSPAALMDNAIDMMRAMSSGQYAFFSVKN